MEQLEAALDKLASEKETLEQELNSGISDHNRIGEIGSRLQMIADETDEAEMRLLELMEKEG